MVVFFKNPYPSAIGKKYLQMERCLEFALKYQGRAVVEAQVCSAQSDSGGGW